MHERQTLAAESKAIFAAAEADSNRDLTPEEARRDDEIAARLTAVEEQVAREERRREREAAVADPSAIEPEALKGRASVHMGTDHDREKPFNNFAEQLVAIKAAALGKISDADSAKLKYVAAAAGAGEALDSDGGFLIQTDFSSEILRRMYTMGAVLSRVRMLPVTGNAIEIPGIDESSRATGSRLGGIQGVGQIADTAFSQTQALEDR